MTLGASPGNSNIFNPDGSQVSFSVVAGFAASDTDISDGTYNYYGFLKADGSWYIMQTTKNQSQLRYFKGTSGYTTAWTNKSTHAYDYFDQIF